MRKKIIISLFFGVCVFTALCSAALAEELHLLSGNAFTSDDSLIYQDRGIDFSNQTFAADYTWTTDSDAQLRSTDTGHGGQEMTGGNLRNHAGNYSATSTWDTGASSTAVFDLHGVYCISCVDVWSTSSANQQMGAITISVSKDGVVYDEVGTWQGTVPPTSEMNSSGQALACSSCDFRDVNARYVKVSGTKARTTLTGGTCYQYVFNEIVIMGTNAVDDTPSAEFYFADENGQRIYGYSENPDVYAKATFTNTDIDLITAWYHENTLKNVSVVHGRFDEYGTSKTISDRIDLSDWEEGDYLKLLAFHSLESMEPLGACVALEDIENTDPGLISGNAGSASELSYPVSAGYDVVTTGKMASAAVLESRVSELFDGNTTSGVLIDNTSDEYASIRVHFSTVMQLSEVNVYAQCSRDSYMSEYDIYASMDGINYDYVMTKVNTTPKVLNRFVATKANLDNTTIYAKHLKIVMKKSPELTKMSLSEIKVYGNYPAFSKERAMNYDYDTGVPFQTSADICTQDSARNQLSDGNMSSSITSTGDYVCAIYDLGEYRQVEDVIIYGTHSGCEVLTGLDGVSYTGIGFYPAKNGITTVHGKSYHNARFVKIVLRKGSMSQIRLSEIELYTRKLYQSGGETNSSAEPVQVKVELKPNNIAYLDWSGYNQTKNQAISYKVFVESTQFTSTNSKQHKPVYCNGGANPVYSVTDQYCIYAGLEPDQDYYIAVLPVTQEQTDGSVTPVKIHTYSALGGEKLSGIFCMNEYPYGGGSHLAHENEESNLKTKLKLITDLEVVSKTRYWAEDQSVLKKYLSRGIGFHIEQVESAAKVQTLNSYGVYSFASENEPEVKSPYENNPGAYVTKVRDNYSLIKGINSKNLLCEAVICGTDKLNWFKSLYQNDSNFGNYYDVVDVHAYCKAFEGRNNTDDTLSLTSEAYSVPEHLFAKTNKIKNALNQCGDNNKDLIFSEIGWSTHTLPYSQENIAESVTREMQANFIPRCYLISASLGIKNVFLYAFQDESYQTTHKEYQYGIVDWYGNPKPAYYTYYALGKILKEAEFVQRVNNLSHPNYGMVFYDNEKDMYITALWNISGNTRNITVTSNDASLLRIDAYGNAEEITSGTVAIKSAPIYIYSSDILAISQ